MGTADSERSSAEEKGNSLSARFCCLQYVSTKYV